jgi:hypothetical protein
MIAGPLEGTLTRSSPFSLLDQPAGKQALQVIWLHRQATGQQSFLVLRFRTTPVHLYLA